MGVPPTSSQIRRRRLAALVALVAVAAVVVLVAALVGGGNSPKRLVPGGGDAQGTYDPLGYDPGRETDLERRAAAGFSDVVYEKSPGGVVTTAKRTARWRKLIEQAARAHGVDPSTLEALVFLESAGREDAIAGRDVEGAAGLTQILAPTATALLGMKVDVQRSRKLTHRIATASTAKQARKLERERRRIDQRFDPAHSLDAAARYLALAKRKFGRDDLAIATYHMGMGNLDNVIARYKAQGGGDHPSYAQLYFDTAPFRKPRAFELLSSLGDDSSTYLWRIRAAQEIMRLSRDDPKALAHLESLDNNGGGGERRLYPDGPPATESGKRRPPGWTKALGLRLVPAAQGDYAPDPATEAVLAYIAAGTKDASGGQAPLIVRSAHGIRLEFERRYRSRRQALAFQHLLDRLQAWNLIAWGRGGSTLAVVTGADALKILPPAAQIARDAQRRP